VRRVLALYAVRYAPVARLHDPEDAAAMSRLTDLNYERVVLRAALLDAGWVTEEPTSTQEGEEMGFGSG
jgi:hypothetical protein